MKHHPQHKRGCTGKVQFVSRAQAEAVRITMHDQAKLHTYPCDFAPHWHIGSIPLWKRRGYCEEKTSISHPLQAA